MDDALFPGEYVSRIETWFEVNNTPDEFKWRKFYVVDGQHRLWAYLKFAQTFPHLDHAYVFPACIAYPVDTSKADLCVLGSEANELDAKGYVKVDNCDQWMTVGDVNN